jgi:hypothetical protein
LQFLNLFFFSLLAGLPPPLKLRCISANITTVGIEVWFIGVVSTFLGLCFDARKNEIGGACGAYAGGEWCAQGVGGEARGKETIGETQT